MFQAGRVVLWVAMLAVVCVCAAGSYEHLVIVPEWTEAPPGSLAMLHGAHAIDTGRWWRVVHIPTLTLCIGAFALLRGHPRRRLVGAAALVYLLVMGATLAWYLPELMALTADPTAAIAPAEWKARGERWELASLVRLGVMYGVAGLLVRAVSWAGEPRHVPPSAVPLDVARTRSTAHDRNAALPDDRLLSR
jgi:hypothetical protein